MLINFYGQISERLNGKATRLFLHKEIFSSKQLNLPGK